jgi:hypothetical protein
LVNLGKPPKLRKSLGKPGFVSLANLICLWFGQPLKPSILSSFNKIGLTGLTQAYFARLGFCQTSDLVLDVKDISGGAPCKLQDRRKP